MTIIYGNDISMPADSTSRSNPTRSRRWFRVSLRTFLLGVTLVCVVLGYVVHGARKQERAVAAIEAVYGRVVYDYQKTKDGIYDVNCISPLPRWMLRGWGRHVWHSVVYVDLDSVAVTDETLEHLAGFQSLEVVHISHTSITADGLIALKKLPALPVLYLNNGAMGDAALQHVAALRHLEYFDVCDPAVTDAGLAYLRNNHNLRRLVIDKTQVTEAGIAELQKALPDCEIEYY